MKVCLRSLVSRFPKGTEQINSFLDRATPYVSAVVMFTLIAVGVWGTVRGQSDVYFDVTQSYETSMGKVYSATNDEGQNIQTLDESSRLATGINLLGDFYGIDAYGEEAVSRAEEIGLPESARIGLLGVVDNEVVALATDPPGVDLPAHLARQWVPGYEDSVSTVYAQGEGYTFLRDTIGIEPFWEMMRNLAYACFVVVIMVVGFMIMFRSKIGGGQVTVGLMNAIPGIVVGLLVVTFSFAIVGFIMDMGRLLCLVIGNYLRGSLGIDTVEFGNPIEMGIGAFTSAAGGGTNAGLALLGGVGAIGLLFTSAFLGPVGPIIGIVMLIVVLIMAAVAFYAAIKVYITLVMTYIKIFVEVIFGPLYILLGSLPGRNGIMDWIKRVISHVLVFPVIYFLLNLAAYIGQSNVNSGFNQAIHFLGGGETGNPSFIQLRGMFVIAIYFVAAGAPAIVTELVGASESKGVMGAMEGAKKAAGKIPLIGGMLGS